jgi:hypothetical protein
METIKFLLDHPVITVSSAVTAAAIIAAGYFRIRIAMLQRQTRKLPLIPAK